MRFLLSIFLALWSVVALANDECVLRIGSSQRVMHDFGHVRVAEVAPTYIWWSKEAGNLVPSDPQGHSQGTFNYNTLYRLTSASGGSWYFRFWGEWFDSAKTHRTAFYGVQWADGKHPELPGDYRVSSVDAPRPQAGRKTFATIGDSMTWFNHAQKFRCDLASKLPHYRFVGSNTDSFGFGHDGHGGDTTYEVLRRIGKIPEADVYFLLIGSNDGGMTPKETAANIKKIVSMLMHRGSRSRVYVSTLPVRGDKQAYLVPERNEAIGHWYTSCECHASVKIIDLRAAMMNTPDALERYIDPAPDLIHPNQAGYDFLSRLIADTVTSDDNARLAKGERYEKDNLFVHTAVDSPGLPHRPNSTRLP